jgi:hypothetical protein
VANFSFTVDTREMADGLYSVAPHVDGATGAVVSMQTAVIMAEKRASEDICRNVNRGFFSLIRSQISQKIAISRSQVEARLLELRDQSQKLSSVKTTMQRDFQMIAVRYTKLFRSLDAALLSRIHDSNTSLLDLVNKDVARMGGRTRVLQASFPIHQLESVSSSQRIAASNTRSKASAAIGAMSRFIRESNQQDRLSSSILGSERADNDATLLLPFALVDCDSLQTRQRQWNYHVPTTPAPEMGQKIKGAIERSVFPALSQIQWREPEAAERENVAICLRALIDGAKLNERVRTHVIRMYSAARSLALSEVRS